jgi:4-diphosphocytidyl-2-C-methyl-D-erythritol kinase
MRVRAFAKINLSLRVLGTRSDGYHELRTIFQSIALHDTLTFRRVRGPLRLTCSFAGNRPPREIDLRSVPDGRANLVWRAAAALWKSARRRGAPRGVAIHLEKRIPLQAGLGGGSSDAAATLRALQKLWQIDPQCVREAAVRLGADVPYFLEGGTVLGLERGDVLFPLIDYPRRWVVLVIPPFGISTADAYAWWDRAKVGPSETTNDLQAPVAKRHPEIARIVGGLTRAGASCAAMSGSGSAVFGLFGARADAEHAARAVRAPARRTLICRTIARAEYRRLAGN